MPPTPLPFTFQQAAIAQNVLAAHAQQAQNQQAAFYQRQNQQAMAAFTGALRLATPALVAVAGVGRSAGSQASFGARVGYGAVNYVAKNIGSSSGSSFLERRLDWALFGMGTGGASVLAQGMLTGARTGDLTYDTSSGLTAGGVTRNAITYGATKFIYNALGVNIAGTGALVGAEERTAAFTTEIARNGGKVDSAFRNWYMSLQVQRENAALNEANLVSQLAATPQMRALADAGGEASKPTSFSNPKFVQILESINGTMDEIYDLFHNWLNKAPQGS